jgi:hypothetical protein
VRERSDVILQQCTLSLASARAGALPARNTQRVDFSDAATEKAARFSALIELPGMRQWH